MAKTLLNNTNNAHGRLTLPVSKLRQYCYRDRPTGQKDPSTCGLLIHKRWDSLNKREGKTIH